jgi:hypothetical protein
MLGSLTAVLTLLAVAMYLLPLIIGLARRVPDVGSVAVLNILLGWTLVGWVLALALAMRSAQPPAEDARGLRPPPRRAPPLQLPPRPPIPRDPTDPR